MPGCRAHVKALSEKANFQVGLAGDCCQCQFNIIRTLFSIFWGWRGEVVGGSVHNISNADYRLHSSSNPGECEQVFNPSWKYNIFHGLWFRECILCRLLSTVTIATCVKHLRQICLLNGLQNDFRGKFWFLWNCIVTRWAFRFSTDATDEIYSPFVVTHVKPKNFQIFKRNFLFCGTSFVGRLFIVFHCRLYCENILGSSNIFRCCSPAQELNKWLKAVIMTFGNRMVVNVSLYSFHVSVVGKNFVEK